MILANKKSITTADGSRIAMLFELSTGIST